MSVKKEGLQTENLHLLVLQGPNLNLLGEREKGIYGLKTLEDIHLRLMEEAQTYGVKLSFFQSNHEGALIDRIHDARVEGINGIIINAGGLTHTSVSLRDALSGTAIPFIEIHVTNVHARESFRHNSYLSPIAAGIVVGFGSMGYSLALQGMIRLLEPESGGS